MLGNAGAIDDRQDVDCDQGLNENHRTRQLLKVLAISDVVIYKSRAERLHTDLFYFMGDASKAYNEHFSSELQKVFCYQNITRTIYKNKLNCNVIEIMRMIGSFETTRLSLTEEARQCLWDQHLLFFMKPVTRIPCQNSKTGKLEVQRM